MATVFYSLSGEGRGHAARVRMVSAALAGQHRVVVLAPGDAYELLAPTADGENLLVRRHPGLSFAYGSGIRLSLARTALAATHYLARLPRLVNRLADDLVRQGADLVISDFEPSLPRAAALAGIPVMTLDHQGFLLVNDLTWLPHRLRRWAAAVAPVIRWFCPSPSHRVVSSFYRPRLRQTRRPVTTVGVLLRDRLRDMTVEDRGHLTAYLRRGAPANVLEALEGCGRPVRVYGMGSRPDADLLSFRPVSEDNFLEDLASCHALVTTAGNQLVGEALFLGKPVLAMPESGNHEQEINARYLERSGAGRWLPMEALNLSALRCFLSDAADLQPLPGTLAAAGNTAALRAVDRVLGLRSSSPGAMPLRRRSAAATEGATP